MSEKCNIRVPWKWLKSALINKKGNLNSASQNEMIFQMTLDIYKCFLIVYHLQQRIATSVKQNTFQRKSSLRL